LRSLAQRLKTTKTSIIVLTPGSKLPDELKDEAVVIEFLHPDASELAAVLDRLTQTPGIKVNLTKLGREKLVQAAVGLTASLAQRIFGRERVMLDRPLDAVARGAAAFVAGVDFYDHIQHDYAIRHINSKTGGYEYRPLVKRGTPYPTTEPLARIAVKAAYDQQQQLGIAIFEMGEPRGPQTDHPMELVFDPSGAARVVQVTPDEQERRNYFWLNEHTPTFLHADPPAQKGEARFEVIFAIDNHKRLLITARDLQTRRLLHQDFPVVKLT